MFSVYDDKYYSVLNNYDEEFFEKKSLILFMVGHNHSRENPCMVYKVEYQDRALIVNITITFDDYPINFQGSLFYNVEVSKFVIKNYKQIDYIANKIVVYD